MKALKGWPLWLGLALCAGPAGAVYEHGTDLGASLNAKAYAESQEPPADEALRREEALRAAAEKKAGQLRNLPPECVQEWIEGRLAEADLERVAQPQAGPPAPQLAAVVRRSHLGRLLLVGALVLFSAVFYVRQRWLEKRAALEQARRRRAAGRRSTGLSLNGMEQVPEYEIPVEDELRVEHAAF